MREHEPTGRYSRRVRVPDNPDKPIFGLNAPLQYRSHMEHGLTEKMVNPYRKLHFGGGLESDSEYPFCGQLRVGYITIQWPTETEGRPRCYFGNK